MCLPADPCLTLLLLCCRLADSCPLASSWVWCLSGICEQLEGKKKKETRVFLPLPLNRHHQLHLLHDLLPPVRSPVAPASLGDLGLWGPRTLVLLIGLQHRGTSGFLLLLTSLDGVLPFLLLSFFTSYVTSSLSQLNFLSLNTVSVFFFRS